MAKVPRQEREKIAEHRIRLILRAQKVATTRTLERKIADAGPYPMRIQPHILTPVKGRLLAAGEIVSISHKGAQWLHLPDEAPDRVQNRMAELAATWSAFTARPVTDRTGETLEVATFRAMVDAKHVTPINGFHDLSAPNVRGRYAKQDQRTFNGRSLGAESLDFIAQAGGEVCGIEVKNIREWLYPDRKEIKDAIRKALILGVVPVIIARRIPYVTYRVLTPCGVLLHQTYNQLMSDWDADIAARAADKKLLGYHDIRVGHDPDSRMTHFISDNLPMLLPQARPKLEANLEALEGFATNTIDFNEFFAITNGKAVDDEEWLDDPLR